MAQPTPLPSLPVYALVLSLVATSCVATMLFSYVAFMVRDFNITHDEAKLGYYAGYLASAYYFGQCCSGTFWGWLADHRSAGKRKVLLIGVANSMISILWFGCSQSYLSAVAARLYGGLGAVNFAIAMSYINHITDESNRNAGYSKLSLAWGIGSIIGPVIGGYLSQPAEKYHLFRTSSFFIKYPYALPSFASTVVLLFAFLLIYFCLPETTTIRKDDQNGDIEIEELDVEEVQVEDLEDIEVERIVPPAPPAVAIFDVEQEEGEEEENSLIEYELSSLSYYADTTEEEAEFVATEQEDTIDDECDFSTSLIRRHHHEEEEVEVVEEGDGDRQVKKKEKEKEKKKKKKKEKGLDKYRQDRNRLNISSMEYGNRLDVSMEYSNRLNNSSYSRQSKKWLELWELIQKHKVTILCIVNYQLLSFLIMTYDEVFPLFAILPSSKGGLNFKTTDLGTLGTIQGIYLVFTQFIVYTPLATAYGALFCERLGAISAILCCALAPHMGQIFTTWLKDLIPGSSILLWSVVIFNGVLRITAGSFCFTSVNVLLNASVSPEMAGKVNGIAFSLGGFMKAIGPSIGGNLFAWSTSHGESTSSWLLNYQFIFHILVLVAVLLLLSTLKIPSDSPHRNNTY